MTKKAIDRALDGGQAVVLRHDPMSRLCRDLFGNLVVVSLRHDEAEPIRLATLSDKRRAVLFDVSMLKRKRRTTNKQ